LFDQLILLEIVSSFFIYMFICRTRWGVFVSYDYAYIVQHII